LILPKTDDFLNLGTEAIQTTDRGSREGQAISGVVLLAVSDHQDCDATVQPTDLGPVRMSPIVAYGFAVEATIFLDPAHKIPSIVPNALPELFGGIPGIEEHIRRATVHAVTRIAE
jgi:hypothetical protein